MPLANGVAFQEAQDKYRRLVESGVKQHFYDVESLAATLRFGSVFHPEFTSKSLPKPTAAKAQRDRSIKEFNDWMNQQNLSQQTWK
jgi:hypothetical protein